MNILINPGAFFQEKINEKEDLTIPAHIVPAAGIIGIFSPYDYFKDNPLAFYNADGALSGTQEIYHETEKFNF